MKTFKKTFKRVLLALVLLIVVLPVAWAAVAGTKARWSGNSLTLDTLSVAVSSTTAVMNVTPTQALTTSNNGPEFSTTANFAEPATDGYAYSFFVTPAWVDPQNAIFAITNSGGPPMAVDIFGNVGSTNGNVNTNQHVLVEVNQTIDLSPALTDGILAEMETPSSGFIQITSGTVSVIAAGTGAATWDLVITDGVDTCTGTATCTTAVFDALTFTGTCFFDNFAGLSLQAQNVTNCATPPNVRNIIIRYNYTTAP